MGRMTFVFRRLVLLIPTARGRHDHHVLHGPPDPRRPGHDHPRPARQPHARRRSWTGEWGLNRPLSTNTGCSSTGCSTATSVPSLYYNVPVSGLITSHLPPTLWLICYAAVMAIIISVPLAMLAASRKDAVRDHIVRGVPLLGLGMPAFWLGPDPANLARPSRSGCSRSPATAGLRRPPALDVPACPDRGDRAVPGPHPQPARQHAERARC